MKTKLLSLLVIMHFILSINAQVGLNAYFGNLHSHTSYSDGKLTPFEAYSYARDTAKLDFLAVTDHMEQISSTEWNKTRNFANAATINGEFIAIAGYEWSSPYYGHVNVFNTTEMPSIFTYTSWQNFRKWLTDRPNAIAQFNHPGDKPEFNNWYDFEYKGLDLDNSFPLIEFQNIKMANDWYEYALNKGWHLSPVWNQDNHSANWGTKNDCRAGVWANELTLDALFEAIKAGRTFATMDKNSSVWIESNNTPMGSTCNRYTNMPFRIVLKDNDNEAWENIQIRSSNGLILSFNSIGNIDTTIYLTLYNDNYIYVKAIQEDGDHIWSAPIYLNGLISNFNNNSDAHTALIYPNPANNQIWINYESNEIEYNITISTFCGKIVKQETLLGNKNIINISEMSAGAYLLEIKSEKNKNTFKIIKY